MFTISINTLINVISTEVWIKKLRSFTQYHRSKKKENKMFITE